MNFRIQGGKKLSGEVAVNTSKNAAMALLCASLLNKGQTTFRRLPKIEEVNRLLEVFASIGVPATWQGDDLLIKPPAKFNLKQLDREAAMRTRSILMFLGPLIHEAEHFTLPHPGGCQLGARSARPHLFALEKLGVKIISKTTHYEVSVPRRPRAGKREIILYETGDTLTENVLMAAARTPGQTIIKLASANYMVQDLCQFLITLGVRIEDVGSGTLTVTGEPNINRDIEFSLGEDPIEAMLFLAIAASTGSSLRIKGCPIDFLELELLKLEKMGFKYKRSAVYKSANGFTNLVDLETKPSKLKALEEKIHPLPSAGINIDNLPFFVPIATRARGTTLIHDWVYENRAIYYAELNKLGAQILLADPHRVLISGPTELRGAELVAPPALRPAAIILVAMLAARGESILRNVYSINRGYANLVPRLKQLGASIEIFD